MNSIRPQAIRGCWASEEWLDIDDGVELQVREVDECKEILVPPGHLHQLPGKMRADALLSDQWWGDPRPVDLGLRSRLGTHGFEIVSCLGEAHLGFVWCLPIASGIVGSQQTDDPIGLLLEDRGKATEDLGRGLE